MSLPSDAFDFSFMEFKIQSTLLFSYEVFLVAFGKGECNLNFLLKAGCPVAFKQKIWGFG